MRIVSAPPIALPYARAGEAAVSRVGARLASGLRITRAADDAAGLAIANAIHADVRGLRVASQNVVESEKMLSIADGAATTIHDALVRARELAVRGTSANSDSQRGVLQRELDQILNQIDQIGKATSYQGTPLLDGTFAGTYRVGSSSSSADRLAVALSDLTLRGLGLEHVQTSTSYGGPISDPVWTKTGSTVSGSSLVAQAGGGVHGAQRSFGPVSASTSNVLMFEASAGTRSMAHVVVTRPSGQKGEWWLDLATGTMVSSQDDMGSWRLDIRTMTEPGWHRYRIDFGTGASGGSPSVQINVHDETSPGTVGYVASASDDIRVRSAHLTNIASSSGERPQLDTNPRGYWAMSSGGLSYHQDPPDRAIDLIDSALARVREATSQIGAAQNRLATVGERLAGKVVELSSAESVLRDADLGAEATAQAAALIREQVALAMSAHENAAPRRLLDLLRN